ncbi:hypothetical protein AMTRI_Chr06g172810 [Amborella trichopoda]|uniref:UDP-glucuronate 4-epimerase n=1 Tax=Amborella trichopoda TaxID=13333 RepID=W1PS44_AMBTC|nr:UDP-glucuronate 4-epimerase 6 [Amborella trichopoda]ERN10075.1 hypothetical protein AMTR_s00013p00257170 [Amborella trichopoda]|eukprot:XP_006848494.1 UDP-glucuronate 4-epimerase 6 [Amborella trichopoda]
MAMADGKGKLERYNSYIRKMNSSKALAASSKLLFRASILIALFLVFFLTLTSYPTEVRRRLSSTSSFGAASARWGGPLWEKQVRHSSTPRRPNGFSVLVTGAAGFVGSHSSLALKKRGDGVLGLDNFNDYYDPSLKRARQALLAKQSIFIVDGDINNAYLLAKLFDVVPFSHVLHLAAQAGVRYALQNPSSYVHSNVAGLVSLFEASRQASPQPAIVWASSSSVYGLNEKAPFSEVDRTDRPASLYAATKKSGEAIAHAYNHIYGLSLTALRFFTVYGPWGRPDMAYFSFTKDILQGKAITIFERADGQDVARDFTYIDDIVRGCIGALDTAQRSTGSGGRKRGPAQLRVYNLGNTSPVTVKGLVGILEGLLGLTAKKNVVRMPGNGDVPFTHANVSSSVRDFGYRPTTDLATGLRKFVKWYVNYYGIKITKGDAASSSSSSRYSS